MKTITNPMTFETEYRNRNTGETFILDIFGPWDRMDEDKAILWSAVRKIEEEKG